MKVLEATVLRILLAACAFYCAVHATTLWAASFTAGSLDKQTIRICFDEPVDLVSAQNMANYNLMLVRKEVKELATNEIAAFANTAKQMKSVASQYKPNTNAYDYFVELHMAVMDFGIHQTPLFLPWHREFIRRFEAELQRVSGNPGMALPYWDWASEESKNLIFSPQFLGGDGDTNDFNFVKDGPFRKGEFPINVIDPTADEFDQNAGNLPGTVWLTRALGASDRARTLPTREEVEAALAPGRNYDVYPWDLTSDPNRSFRNYLEGWRRPNPSTIHNQVHNWIGGDMATGASPNDPAFFLNHANADRIWALWQELYGNSTFPASFKGPQMYGFPEVSVESTFEIRDSGRRYSSQTGGPRVLAARLESDGRTVVLTVTNSGKGFSVAINGVRTTNGIAISGSASGSVPGLASADVGAGPIAGEAFSCENRAVTVRTSGAGLTDANDSFQFNYRLQPGEFDVRVHVQKLEGPASIGGLIARQSLDPRSDYLGVFVTRTETGTVWKVLGRAAAPIQGTWPAATDFPNAWLRLARNSNDLYSIYASSNGVSWTTLLQSGIQRGVTSNLPLVGIATAAGNSSTEAVVEYRDFGDLVPVPIPGLAIARQTNDVKLAWYTFDPNYLLEASADVSAASWIPLVRSKEWNNEAVSPSEGRAVFFRLRKIEPR